VSDTVTLAAYLRIVDNQYKKFSESDNLAIFHDEIP